MPSKHRPALALAHNNKMLGVPSPKRFGVLRFKKNSADPTHASHGGVSYAVVSALAKQYLEGLHHAKYLYPCTSVRIEKIHHLLGVLCSLEERDVEYGQNQSMAA